MPPPFRAVSWAFLASAVLVQGWSRQQGLKFPSRRPELRSGILGVPSIGSASSSNPLLNFLGSLKRKTEISALSAELAELLTQKSVATWELQAARCEEIIGILSEAECTVTFGEGLWVSRYVRGDTRWQRSASLLQGLLPEENLSGQRYCADTGSVCNYSELLGQNIYLRACGQFRPASANPGSGQGLCGVY